MEDITTAHRSQPTAHSPEIHREVLVAIQAKDAVQVVVVEGGGGADAATDGLAGEVEVLSDVTGFEVDVAVTAVCIAPGHSGGDSGPDEGDRALLDEFGLQTGFRDSGCNGWILAEDLELMGRTHVTI